MRIYTETSLRNFQFWDGAKDRAKYLTSDQLDRIESILEMDNPDGMEDTEINDIFWFEEDWIADMLGFSSWENLEAGIDRETEEEIDRIQEEIDEAEEELHDLLSALEDEDLNEEEREEITERVEILEGDIEDLYDEMEDLTPET